MSPRPTKRAAILRATERVVAERGYSALTLDAVAEAAGVSKGGLLYHFPSKEALVAGLLEELAAAFDADQVAERGEDVAPGAWTRAFVRSSVAPSSAPTHSAAVALLAAVGHDPTLLAPLQERYREWVGRLEDDGLEGVDAHVVRLAADGLWAADLFNLAPPEEALRARILQRLDELAGGGEGP